MRKTYPKLLKKDRSEIKNIALYDAIMKSDYNQPEIAQRVGVATRTVQKWLYSDQRPLPEHAVVLKELFPELDMESLK